MSFDDRDYYRAEVARKTRPETARKAVRVVLSKPAAGWHWTLKFALWLVICLAAFLVLRLIGRT